MHKKSMFNLFFIFTYSLHAEFLLFFHAARASEKYPAHRQQDSGKIARLILDYCGPWLPMEPLERKLGKIPIPQKIDFFDMDDVGLPTIGPRIWACYDRVLHPGGAIGYSRTLIPLIDNTTAFHVAHLEKLCTCLKTPGQTTTIFSSNGMYRIQASHKKDSTQLKLLSAIKRAYNSIKLIPHLIPFFENNE